MYYIEWVRYWHDSNEHIIVYIAHPQACHRLALGSAQERRTVRPKTASVVAEPADSPVDYHVFNSLESENSTSSSSYLN
jgi:hypothetical protein